MCIFDRSGVITEKAGRSAGSIVIVFQFYIADCISASVKDTAEAFFVGIARDRVCPWF